MNTRSGNSDEDSNDDHSEYLSFKKQKRQTQVSAKKADIFNAAKYDGVHDCYFRAKVASSKQKKMWRIKSTVYIRLSRKTVTQF